MTRIDTPEDLRKLLQSGLGPHYVYVLRKPDGVVSHGGVGTPFYVGIGQRGRLFEHERAARDGTEQGPKIDVIRTIWSEGGDVVRTIEGFYANEPLLREAEVIHAIGRLADGNGSLTNLQTYARSHKMDGVEVRKYAAEQTQAGGVDAIPARFKLRRTRLRAGPRVPRSLSTVMGKVYQATLEHPGATGEELVAILSKFDFSDNKSAYTQGGQICASWLCGYIEGAYFRSDKQHLAEYCE